LIEWTGIQTLSLKGVFRNRTGTSLTDSRRIYEESSVASDTIIIV